MINFQYKKNVFNKSLDERTDQIQKMSGDIEFNNLTYYLKSQNPAPINFISFRGPLNIYKEIKNGNININDNINKKSRRTSKEI